MVENVTSAVIKRCNLESTLTIGAEYIKMGLPAETSLIEPQYQDVLAGKIEISE